MNMKVCWFVVVLALLFVSSSDAVGVRRINKKEAKQSQTAHLAANTFSALQRAKTTQQLQQQRMAEAVRQQTTTTATRMLVQQALHVDLSTEAKSAPGQLRENPFKLQQGTVFAQNDQFPFSGAYTYMFFIKPLNIVYDWGNIFHKGQDNHFRNPAVWIYPWDMKFHVRSGIRTNPWWDNGGNNGCDTEFRANIGEWTHFALIHDNQGLRTFFNGFPSCRDNYGAPVANSGPLWMADPWHSAANALVADFRYINRAVAPSEIMQAYLDRKGCN